MICRGGENVYPREIEEFLYTHPAVADVQVIGVPDRKYVEQVAAWVKLKEGVVCKRGRHQKLLQGPYRRLQDPPLHQVRRFFPHDGDRQDSEIQDEGNIDTGMGSGFGRGDRDGVVRESARRQINRHLNGRLFWTVMCR